MERIAFLRHGHRRFSRQRRRNIKDFKILIALSKSKSTDSNREGFKAYLSFVTYIFLILKSNVKFF